MKKIQFIHLTFIFLLSVILGACGEDKHGPAMSPPEVDVIKPLKKSLTLWDEYSGRFKPVEIVELRARVTGYLVEKKFVDGEIVKKGDILFVIDPRPFEFELSHAQAQHKLCLKDYDRARNLLKTHAISKEEFDRRMHEFEMARANLYSAKLNLSFTKIKAPFDGRMSDGFIDVGNLVRASDTVLTTIVSLNPIHFEFEVSQNDLLHYIRLDRSGKRPGNENNANPIFVKLQDESKFSHLGFIDFVDNSVGKGTGTIRTRALVENDDLIIYPGVFGRGRLIGERDIKHIVLPENSINTDQNRKFVYTVGAGNKATRTYVQVGRLLDNGFVIIEKGLSGEENVVVSGIQRIRMPEQPVTPKKVQVEWKENDKLPDPSMIKVPKPERKSKKIMKNRD